MRAHCIIFQEASEHFWWSAKFSQQFLYVPLKKRGTSKGASTPPRPCSEISGISWMDLREHFSFCTTISIDLRQDVKSYLIKTQDSGIFSVGLICTLHHVEVMFMVITRSSSAFPG